jgi:hypothetical protein
MMKKLSLLQDGAGALHSVDAAGVTQLVGTASQVAVDDTGETARRRLGRRRSLSSSPGRAWVSSSTRPRARSAISC